MAIFNRSKERWIPTKPLNKTSKNRTVHFERDVDSASSPKPFELNKRLWFWLDAQYLDNTDVYNVWYMNATNDGYEKSTFVHEGDNPTVNPIRGARFLQKSVDFSYTGNQGYIQQGPFDLPELLLTHDGANYLTTDSAFWISFWYRSPDRYPGNTSVGQSIGGFVKVDPNSSTPSTTDDPTELKPSLAIYITGSGFVSIRVSSDGSQSNATIIDNSIGDLHFAECTSSRSTLDSEWNFVSICIPTSSSSTNDLTTISARDMMTRTRIWINGIEDKNLDVADEYDDFDVSLFGNQHYLVLGNATGFWGTRTHPNISPCVGFEGGIGEFVMMNYHSDNLDDTARFLYEAYREGVYSVHSGTHMSEPLKEVVARRRVRYYPPNNGGTDQHVLTTASGSMFEEGRPMLLGNTGEYDTPHPFDYDASKFYKKSDTILPHMQISPHDEILGHWLASDRSIFFEEDLQDPLDDGFSIQSQNNEEITSDWLYPLHEQEQTVGPFNDVLRHETNEDFYNAFTIDIPISWGEQDCYLSTDSINEQPFIDGDQGQLVYDAYFLGTQFTPSLSGVNAKIGWQYDDCDSIIGSSGTYHFPWSPTPAAIAGGYEEFERAQFLGFNCNNGDTNGFTLPSKGDDFAFLIDSGELESWRKLITYWKHVIQGYFGIIGPQMTEATQDDGVDPDFKPIGGYLLNDTTIPFEFKTHWRANPFWANILATIAAIPNPDTLIEAGQIDVLDTYVQDGVYFFQAVYLLKSITTGLKWLPSHYDPQNPSYGDPLTLNELSPDTSTFPAPEYSTGTSSMYLMLPTENSGDTVFPINAVKIIDAYVGNAGAWWYPTTNFSMLQSAGYFAVYEALTDPTTHVAQQTNIDMTTMAYHNFSKGTWEPLQSFGTSTGTTFTRPDPGEFMEDATIGFTPMSGLMYPHRADLLESVVDSAGRPTDSFGFPFHDKFKANNDTTFDLSQYFSEPVVLKGWELRMDVVPRTGPTTGSDINWGSNANYESTYGMESSNVLVTPTMSGSIVSGEVATYQFGNTFPTTNFNSINRSVNTLHGQLTKGVTAFLMKQSDKSPQGNNLDVFTRDSHEVNFYSNHVASSKSTTSKQDELVLIETAVPGRIHRPSYPNPGITIDNGPFDPAKTFYEADETRELIGYLQHVYHNDHKWSSDIPYTFRQSQRTLAGMSVVGVNQSVNFDEVFDRENNTYVSNLKTNTSTKYSFHVSGSVKIPSKNTAQSIISPFFLRKNSIPSSGDEYFFDNAIAATSEYQDFLTSYSISNNWSGGTGTGELSNGEFLNSVVGQEIAEDEWHVPRMAVPTNIGTTADEKLQKDIKKMAINSVIDSDVILYPHDKLILGIQDSISTTIGSQLVGPNGELWKWGRNHLSIPSEQTGAYLRLYVERQQDGKALIPRSNQSHGFTEDVNEDLGNTMILDQYDVAPSRMYSGSMGDDIMGPQPLVGASAEIRVSHSQFQGDGINDFDPTSYVFPTFGDTKFKINYGVVQTGADPNYSEFSEFPAYEDPDNPPNITPYPALTYNWIMLNELVFKDRTPSTHTDHETGTACFYRKPNFIEEAGGGGDYQQDAFKAQLGATKVNMWPVTSDSTKINPYPNLGNQHLKKGGRLGGCCALWELNRNPNRVIPTGAANMMTVDDFNDDFSFLSSEECPAFSPWKFKAIIPLFKNSCLGISYEYMVITLRLICTDAASIPEAQNPANQNAYEELKPGDIFVFSKADSDPTRGSIPILVYKNGFGFTDHSWSQEAYGEQGVLSADLYMVGAEGNVTAALDLQNGDPAYHYCFQTSADDTFNPWNPNLLISWDELMGNIKTVLDAESQLIEGLNYTITTNYDEEDWFQIQIINDDFAINNLKSYEDIFNDALEFSLLGFTGTPEDRPDNKLWLYRDAEPNNFNVGFGPTPMAIYDLNQFQLEIDTVTGYQVIEHVAENDPNHDTYKAIPMMTDTYLYIHKFADHPIYSSDDDPDGAGPLVAGRWRPTGVPGNHLHAARNITIDYSGLPTNKGVSMTVTLASQIPSQNLNKSHLIDRKVTFRTSEGTAGPFGSLTRFKKLKFAEGQRNAVIFDSVPRRITNSINQESFDLSTPIPTGWPMVDYSELPVYTWEAESVQVPVSVDGLNAVPVLPVSTVTNQREDMEVSLLDESGNSVTFLNQPLIPGTIELLDYISAEFPSVKDAKKLISDLLSGFGDGPQGRLVIRPDLFKYDAFENDNGDPNGSPTHFNMKLDPVRGARFGLQNTRLQYRCAIINQYQHGQPNQLLEPVLDHASVPLDDPLTGSPINYRSKNPNDPSVDVDRLNNNRRNKDLFQRIFFPFRDRYIPAPPIGGLVPPSEDQYDPLDDIGDAIVTTSQSGDSVNLETGQTYDTNNNVLPQPQSNPNLTVNLVGNIASRAVVSPGNINTNIRKK